MFNLSSLADASRGRCREIGKEKEQEWEEAGEDAQLFSLAAFSGCCYGWCPVPVKLKCCSGLNTHQAGGKDLLWVERLVVARHS